MGRYKSYNVIAMCVTLVLFFSLVPVPAYPTNSTTAKKIVVSPVEVVNPIVAEETFYVSTDREEYELGESAIIYARLYSNTRDADVWAEVETPSGERVEVSLEKTFCALRASVIEAGSNAAKEEEETWATCQYTGKVRIRSEGPYYVTAYAYTSSAMYRSETKFMAYKATETKYVHLNQKFSLSVGASAIVVDYGDMRITLNKLSNSNCRILTNTEEVKSATYTESARKVECPQDGPKAYISVRSPFVYPALSVREATSSSGSTTNALRTATAVSLTGLRSPKRIGEKSVEAYAEEVSPEEAVALSEGETISAFGAKISLLEVDMERQEAVFMVSTEALGDYVDVRIEPNRQSVRSGEVAKYEITVRDKHNYYEKTTKKRYYTYKLAVLNLPFSLDYERAIRVPSGGRSTIVLLVDTSMPMEASTYTEAVSEKSEVVEVNATPVPETDTTTSGESADSSNSGEEPLIVEVSPEAQKKKVKVAPSVVASGSAYRFRVLVVGEDGSEDSSYATLNLLYQVPPVYETVELGLKSGWNLIALPGDGKLEKGTCSSIDKLYAFVYIAEAGKYMTLKQAEDYMGPERLMEYLKHHSFWVYSFRECSMRFKLRKETSFNDLELSRGWNFLPITGDMEGGSLEEVGPECDFESAYYWDPEAQRWREWGVDEGFTEEMIYRGIVVKVSDSCEFGWGSVLLPPPLPE